ncbi:MAG: SGNH/GDSL hydrolase family protein [Clostridia bacterium]|nr:SGNH/GDSL hydrolase family protein [Clostridia bacterium]
MKKNKVNIILPEKLYFLRANPNLYGAYGFCSPHGQAEYNLYYRNFIYPFDENLDIEMKCEFGTKYINRWSFDGVCDKDSFTMEINVYSAFGELLATKKSIVYMVSESRKPFGLLCIGDSMTRSGAYITHVAERLQSLNTIGTKCYDGKNFSEGRGGWRTEYYMDFTNGEHSFSPFLFPKTVSGDKYLGDIKFWNKVILDEVDDYVCTGLKAVPEYLGLKEFDEKGFPVNFNDGDVVYNDGLHIAENGKWVSFEDEFDFDFSKYVERYRNYKGMHKIDAVSILLGTNDLYFVPYAELESKIAESLSNFEKIIDSVKKYDNNIKIIINMPILGAGAWDGEAAPPDATVKHQRFAILSMCDAIIEKWDNEKSIEKGIYISPMMNFLDMVDGFKKGSVKKNKYTDLTELFFADWIHPSLNGYRQMGDVLTGVVSYLMNK